MKIVNICVRRNSFRNALRNSDPSLKKWPCKKSREDSSLVNSRNHPRSRQPTRVIREEREVPKEVKRKGESKFRKVRRKKRRVLALLSKIK